MASALRAIALRLRPGLSRRPRSARAPGDFRRSPLGRPGLASPLVRYKTLSRFDDYIHPTKKGLSAFANRPFLVGYLDANIAAEVSSLKTSVISGIQCVPLVKDWNFLHRKYVVEGLSPAEIGRLCFSSRTSVKKYLREFGIPLRMGDNRKTRSQLGFGETWKGRRIVVHKREQELIGKMQKLRVEGLSYWKVASVLNAWGIPTKTRKGKWSAKQVHQILVRVGRVRSDTTHLPPGQN